MNKQQWIDKINKIKKSVKITNNKSNLKKKIIEVIGNLIPNKKFGIMFSGGLDSSLIALICKKFTKNFICYCVGFKDGNMKMPEDIIHSKKVAKRFGFKLKTKIYNLKELEEIIKKTNKLMGKHNNIINIGVGAVEIGVLELAKEKYFFSGLGAEEIFAGYERHRVEDIDRECWKGLKSMYERDLIRDNLIQKKYNVKFLTPFLNEEVIKLAMSIDAKYKLNKTGNKLVLRKIAKELGLGEYSFRRKKAAQYGSSFIKGIKKLTKLNNFKYMKDYLKGL